MIDTETALRFRQFGVAIRWSYPDTVVDGTVGFSTSMPVFDSNHSMAAYKAPLWTIGAAS